MASNGVPLNTDVLRSARLSKGLTSRQVAAEFEALSGRELSHVTYMRWENGAHGPYPRNVPILAEVVGLKVDELIKKLDAAA
jgi:transcriptional regulator with XRE-family HTH domain